MIYKHVFGFLYEYYIQSRALRHDKLLNLNLNAKLKVFLSVIFALERNVHDSHHLSFVMWNAHRKLVNCKGKSAFPALQIKDFKSASNLGLNF